MPRVDSTMEQVSWPSSGVTLVPFRLYSEHKRGATPAQLAATFAVSVPWVEERIEAARLCIEKQVRVELSN